MSKVIEMRPWSVDCPLEIRPCECGEGEEGPEFYACTHWELDGIDGYRVGCPTCGNLTPEYKTRADAVRCWNEGWAL